MTGSTLLTYIFHRLMADLLSNGGKAEVFDRCKQLQVDLGWEFDPKCDPAYEMDAVAVLTNSGGHIRHRLDLVTYDSENLITLDGEEHPCSYDESVIGPATYGDQEVAPGVGRVEFLVDLSKTDKRVKVIHFALCLYWDETNLRDVRRSYNFGKLSNVYISFKEQSTGKELLRHQLNILNVNNCKGAVIGQLCRKGDSWRYAAKGIGLKNGWEDILNRFANAPMEALDF